MFCYFVDLFYFTSYSYFKYTYKYLFIFSQPSL